MITRLIKILVLSFLLGFGIYLIIAPLAEPAPAVYTSTVYPTPEPLSAVILSEKVNKWRVENGLNSLPEESSLCRYADQRAEEIKTDWSHDKFYATRCSSVNFTYCGENLSRGYPTAQQTLNAWIESPTHLENLQRVWSAMCIRCSDNYCAQEFGL